MSDFWKGRRVFVARPGTFRGSWLCKFLIEHGAQVFAFGPPPKTNPNFFDLENISGRASVVFGDLRDRQALADTLQFAEAEVVFHLGESPRFDEVDSAPVQYISDEIIGAANLLECLRDTATVRGVVIESSDRVYLSGSTPGQVSESAAVGPDKIPATTKLCVELIAQAFQQQYFSPEKFNKHKVAISIARMGPGTGYGDFSEEGLLYQAAFSWHQGKVFEILKPHSVRGWTDIRDQVEGLAVIAKALLEQGPKLAGIYNIPEKEDRAVGGLVSEFASFWGAQDLLKLPSEETRKGSSYHRQLSGTLMTEKLGWAPQRSMSGTLKDMVDWYQKYL